MVDGRKREAHGKRLVEAKLVKVKYYPNLHLRSSGVRDRGMKRRGRNSGGMG